MGPSKKTKQDKKNKTKTSQTVNKNNPAQNFFSIAQFPTKKQHPFCSFYNQKIIYTSSISQLLFLRISRSTTGKGNSNYYCPRFSKNPRIIFFFVNTSRANFIRLFNQSSM